MPRLTQHRNHARDMAPLARLLADLDDLAFVNRTAPSPSIPANGR